jgi:hypothetical protein
LISSSSPKKLVEAARAEGIELVGPEGLPTGLIDPAQLGSCARGAGRDLGRPAQGIGGVRELRRHDPETARHIKRMPWSPSRFENRIEA